MIGLAVCVGLLIILHRPILLAIVRHFAISYATKENLKTDFRLEGNPFSYLTVRNLHAVPTGPSAIESVDVDSLYVDYSLLGFVRRGVSHFLQNVELRGAQVVLNPARAPPPKPRTKKGPTLPDAFPERIRLADATLIVRESPNDFVIEHADLDLNPRAPGELRIARLQLPLRPQLVQSFRTDFLHEQELHPARRGSQRSGTNSAFKHRCIAHRFQSSRHRSQLHHWRWPVVCLGWVERKRIFSEHEGESGCRENRG